LAVFVDRSLLQSATEEWAGLFDEFTLVKAMQSTSVVGCHSKFYLMVWKGYPEVEYCIASKSFGCKKVEEFGKVRSKERY
jgi:hypothetical protein